MAPDSGSYCPECGAYHPGRYHSFQDDPKNYQGQFITKIYVNTQTGETPKQAYRRMVK